MLSLPATPHPEATAREAVPVLMRLLRLPIVSVQMHLLGLAAHCARAVPPTQSVCTPIAVALHLSQPLSPRLAACASIPVGPRLELAPAIPYLQSARSCGWACPHFSTRPGRKVLASPSLSLRVGFRAWVSTRAHSGAKAGCVS
jgi:hypothetical protein